MLYPFTLKLNNRSQMMNGLRVQVKVFRFLPLRKILLNHLNDVINVQRERVNGMCFNRHAHLDDALQFLSPKLRGLDGLHYAASLTTDFPSMFCTVMTCAFSCAKVI